MVLLHLKCLGARLFLGWKQAFKNLAMLQKSNSLSARSPSRLDEGQEPQWKQQLTICIIFEFHLSLREFPYLKAKHNSAIQTKILKLSLQQAQESTTAFTLNCEQEFMCYRAPTMCISQPADPGPNVYHQFRGKFVLS